MPVNQADRLREALSQSIVWWVGLILALLALAWVVHQLHAWYRGGADPADDNGETIRQMEELNRRGELTDEEIRSIKSQFSGRKNR